MVDLPAHQNEAMCISELPDHQREVSCAAADAPDSAAGGARVPSRGALLAQSWLGVGNAPYGEDRPVAAMELFAGELCRVHLSR